MRFRIDRNSKHISPLSADCPACFAYQVRKPENTEHCVPAKVQLLLLLHDFLGKHIGRGCFQQRSPQSRPKRSALCSCDIPFAKGAEGLGQSASDCGGHFFPKRGDAPTHSSLSRKNEDRVSQGQHSVPRPLQVSQWRTMHPHIQNKTDTWSRSQPWPQLAPENTHTRVFPCFKAGSPRTSKQSQATHPGQKPLPPLPPSLPPSSTGRPSPPRSLSSQTSCFALAVFQHQSIFYPGTSLPERSNEQQPVATAPSEQIMCGRKGGGPGGRARGAEGEEEAVRLSFFVRHPLLLFSRTLGRPLEAEKGRARQRLVC